MKPYADDEDIDMDDETSEDDDDIPEKDESEEKLERMLFGDDEGFMGALKSQQERADAMALTLQSDQESGSADEAEDDDEGGMGNMADSDVREPVRRSFGVCWCDANRSFSTSSSFLTLAQTPFLKMLFPRQTLHLAQKMMRKSPRRQSGMTATTSDWLCLSRVRPDCENCG